MKNSFFLLLIILFFSRCNSGTTGNGNIITEKRNVPSFHGINSDAVAQTTLIQDSVQSVEIKGDQNLVSQMHISVDDGVLTIKMKNDITISGKPHLEVIIHVPDVDQLELQSVGNINSQGNFNFDRVVIKLSGVGSIYISGHAAKATLTNVGTGFIHCNNLVCDTIIAVTSGVGNIQCNAVKFLKATVSGVGNISYNGDPVLEKNVTGIGSVKKD